MNRPPLQGMLELGLYVKDVSRSIEFYCNFFGFHVLVSDERFAALDVEGKQILLLFKQGSSAELQEAYYQVMMEKVQLIWRFQ